MISKVFIGKSVYFCLSLILHTYHATTIVERPSNNLDAYLPRRLNTINALRALDRGQIPFESFISRNVNSLKPLPEVPPNYVDAMVPRHVNQFKLGGVDNIAPNNAQLQKQLNYFKKLTAQFPDRDIEIQVDIPTSRPAAIANLWPQRKVLNYNIYEDPLFNPPYTFGGQYGQGPNLAMYRRASTSEVTSSSKRRSNKGHHKSNSKEHNAEENSGDEKSNEKSQEKSKSRPSKEILTKQDLKAELEKLEKKLLESPNFNNNINKNGNRQSPNDQVELTSDQQKKLDLFLDIIKKGEAEPVELSRPSQFAGDLKWFKIPLSATGGKKL